MLTHITTPAPAAVPIVAAAPARPPAQVIRLAVAIIEAMVGRRPLHHLRVWLSPHAFDHLVRARQSGRFRRSRMGTWRCQMPHDDAAEISIRVSLAKRWLVCVFRMDRIARWTCSEFSVLDG